MIKRRAGAPKPEVMDFTDDNLDANANSVQEKTKVLKAVAIQKVLLAMKPRDLILVSCMRVGSAAYCGKHQSNASSLIQMQPVESFEFSSHTICVPCLKVYMENLPEKTSQEPEIKVEELCDDQLMMACIEHEAPYKIEEPEEILKYFVHLVSENLVEKFFDTYPIPQSQEILALTHNSYKITDSDMDNIIDSLTSLFISRIITHEEPNKNIFCQSALVTKLLGLKLKTNNLDNRKSGLVANEDTEEIKRLRDVFKRKTVHNKFRVNTKPRVIFMPYLKSDHWTLFILSEPEDKSSQGTIGFFNSKTIPDFLTNLDEVERIKSLVQDIELTGTAKNWKLKDIGKATQIDADLTSCGFFVIYQILAHCFPKVFFNEFKVSNAMGDTVAFVKAFLMFMKIYNRFPVKLK